MMAKIRWQFFFVGQRKNDLATLEKTVEGKDATVAEACQGVEGELAKAENAIAAIDAFHSNITKHWSTVSNRVSDHVVYAPPISVGTGPKQFTEDWALIELNRDKIDWNNSKGNVVYFGTFRSILLRSSSLTNYVQETRFRSLTLSERCTLTPRTAPPLSIRFAVSCKSRACSRRRKYTNQPCSTKKERSAL